MLAAAIGFVAGERQWVRDILTVGRSRAQRRSRHPARSRRVRGNDRARVGDWDPELGIVLVVDLMAALVLLVAMATILVVSSSPSAAAHCVGRRPPLSGPLLLVLTSGVVLAFLTGDLFTLFVAFELILVSSYVLLTHQGRRGRSVRHDLCGDEPLRLDPLPRRPRRRLRLDRHGQSGPAAERIPELDDPLRWGIGLWFLVVFGTKAAIFPLFSWLPDSYPTAPTTITAVFAGLLTKIGVYVLIRFHVLTGMDDLGPLILTLAALTMVIGVAGALAQDDVKRILSFHIISQIGYMLMGLGLFTLAGIAGAIVFLVHHIPVKTVLFLVGGLIEEREGTSALDKIGGLAQRQPLLAVLFALPALSLAGIPPFSGFVAKLALVDAGIEKVVVPIVVIALANSVLTSCRW